MQRCVPGHGTLCFCFGGIPDFAPTVKMKVKVRVAKGYFVPKVKMKGENVMSKPHRTNTDSKNTIIIARNLSTTCIQSFMSIPKRGVKLSKTVIVHIMNNPNDCTEDGHDLRDIEYKMLGYNELSNTQTLQKRSGLVGCCGFILEFGRKLAQAKDGNMALIGTPVAMVDQYPIPWEETCNFVLTHAQTESPPHRSLEMHFAIWKDN